MFKVHVQLYIHKKMVMASVFFFFLTDYLFSKRQKKKNKDTNDTHTSIMHTYKINRRKD